MFSLQHDAHPKSLVSLFEPVYSEGGDTLYVMDQISDKKNREGPAGLRICPYVKL